MIRACMLCGLALASGAAPAQESAEQPAPQEPAAAEAPPLDTIPVETDEAPAPPADEPAVLEDIVVTATKRAVSVREIPATVNALAGDDLERLGAQGVDDFVKLVPGVNINDDGGQGPRRVTVRGITAELQTVFATGVLFGDVPFNDLFVPIVHLDPNPFDLATVEVLKGPHGTLFGGYGLNGMIRYVPEPPKLATTELRYYVQYLDFEQGGREPTYGAAANVPIGDAAAFRVVGFQRAAPGYTDDTQAGVAGDPLGNDLPDTYQSDTLWNYELGARADWLGRTLQTDAAIYYIEWDEPQLLQRTPDGLFTFTDNVGGARGQGAELAVRYRVPFVDGLTLDVRGAWNETITTVPFTASSGTPVEPGSPWPYAPQWQTTSALSYVLSLGTWQGSVLLRHNYTSKAWNVVERTAEVFGYRTWDVQLGVGNLAWRWLPELNLTATNLTDERGITGVLFLPNAEPSVTYVAPRSLLLRLSGAF